MSQKPTVYLVRGYAIEHTVGYVRNVVGGLGDVEIVAVEHLNLSGHDRNAKLPEGVVAKVIGPREDILKIPIRQEDAVVLSFATSDADVALLDQLSCRGWACRRMAWREGKMQYLPREKNALQPVVLNLIDALIAQGESDYGGGLGPQQAMQRAASALGMEFHKLMDERRKVLHPNPPHKYKNDSGV